MEDKPVGKDDLISRAAALDAIDNMKPMQGNMEQLAMKALCWAAIKTIQPVDAASIIRCRDCVYFRPNVHDRGDDSFCVWFTHETSADDYCSKAERRCDEDYCEIGGE